MSRVETILSRARATLADKNKQRWSDQDLLDLLDDGQKDIALHKKLLRTRAILVIPKLTAYVTLPTDLLRLTRVTLNGSKLPIVSHDQLDAYLDVGSDLVDRRGAEVFDIFEDGWEEHTGPRPRAMVFDRSNMGEIRVYPIIDGTAGTEYPITNADSPLDPNVGVVTAIGALTATMPYGVVTNIIVSGIDGFSATSPYGVTTSISESTDVVILHYIRKPTAINTITSELEIDDSHDKALRFYVIAMALHSDLDVKNNVYAKDWYNLYQQELGLATEEAAMDATLATQYNTMYRGAFND